MTPVGIYLNHSRPRLPFDGAIPCLFVYLVFEREIDSSFNAVRRINDWLWNRLKQNAHREADWQYIKIWELVMTSTQVVLNVGISSKIMLISQISRGTLERTTRRIALSTKTHSIAGRSTHLYTSEWLHFRFPFSRDFAFKCSRLTFCCPSRLRLYIKLQCIHSCSVIYSALSLYLGVCDHITRKNAPLFNK